MDQGGLRAQCDHCVWWVDSDDARGHCRYRTEAMASNEAWRQITLGRCSHFLRATSGSPTKATSKDDQ